MDNSIEVFNCPLCSFCETGLDRLVKHIREHIKPEPIPPPTTDQTPTTIDSPILPRDYNEVNQQKERLDNYINNLSSTKDPSPANKLFSSSLKGDVVTNGDDTNKPSNKMVPEKNTDHQPSHSLNTEKSLLHQQPHIQLTALPANLPHVLNNDMMKPMHISPPQTNHQPPSQSMMYVRNEASKYVKIHPSPYGNHHHQQQPPLPQQQQQQAQYKLSLIHI